MGQDSNIEWCDGTVNPTSGCQGCELWTPGDGSGKTPERHCYAGTLHEGRLAKSLPLLYAPSFSEVRLIPGRMAKAARWPDLTGTDRPDKPWLNGLPRVIFVGDMGDVFSKGVPFDFLKSELTDVAVSPAGRRHVWMVLTKQPQRAAEFGAWLKARGVDWPENIWPGTSVTRQATTSRIHHLIHVGGPGTVRFISVEPLLEAVDVEPWFWLNGGSTAGPFFDAAGRRRGGGGIGGQTMTAVRSRDISLCIVGGESGPGARPMDLQWARDIVRQCQDAGVPVFVKQLGSKPVAWDVGAGDEFTPDAPGYCQVGYRGKPLRDRKGGSPEEWPDDLRIRQFPRPAQAVGV